MNAGRKRKERTIDADHSEVYFKPGGTPRRLIERVVIHEDEMEAIRLADLESIYQ